MSPPASPGAARSRRSGQARSPTRGSGWPSSPGTIWGSPALARWVEITGHGSLIVSGRSDATLNRHGVRLGSAEIYTAIEALPEIADSLVIGAELGDGDYWLVLFVVLGPDVVLSGELVDLVKARIRAQASPRHVPDDVIAVPALPHTRTGKRLEIPVKRLIQGQPLAAVASADAVDDLEALAQFVGWSKGGS
jgi:acetoacetyl-CoA synthetase